jgi:hypothetical protein
MIHGTSHQDYPLVTAKVSLPADGERLFVLNPNGQIIPYSVFGHQPVAKDWLDEAILEASLNENCGNRTSALRTFAECIIVFAWQTERMHAPSLRLGRSGKKVFRQDRTPMSAFKQRFNRRWCLRRR